MLGWSKKLEYIFKITNTKNKPIKPKISSTKNSMREKTMIFIKKTTKRHLGNIRHFEIYSLTKTDVYLGSLDNILHFDGTKNS
jgi:hypothetical protein